MKFSRAVRDLPSRGSRAQRIGHEQLNPLTADMFTIGASGRTDKSGVDEALLPWSFDREKMEAQSAPRC